MSTTPTDANRDFNPALEIWWKYAVLRGNTVPAKFNGRWLDLSAVPEDEILRGIFVVLTADVSPARFIPTNKWEQNEDGEVAVVYEWVR